MILLFIIIILILFIFIEMVVRPILGNYPRYKEYKEYEKRMNNIVLGNFRNEEFNDLRFNGYSKIKRKHRNKPERIDKYYKDSNFNQDDFEFSLFPHTSLYLKIKEKHILIDPIINHKHVFPHLDCVLITHNHHDHCDKRSIQFLDKQTDKFIVPLGLKRLLKSWNINENKIIELAWNEDYFIDELNIICFPARHYSNRNILDGNRTLWCSYALISEDYNIYISGDSGYGKHIEKIHSYINHFDYVFIECGIYKYHNVNMHMLPEFCVYSAEVLNATYLVPMLNYNKHLLTNRHKDAMERLLNKAKMNELTILTPYLYEVVSDTYAKNHQKRWMLKDLN